MASLNNCSFIGNVGKDVKVVPVGKNNTPKADVSLAVKVGYGDHEHTIWIKGEVWGKAAEFAAKYITTGALVYIEGEQDVSEWEKDGQKRREHFIRVKNIQLLKDGKERAESDQGSDQDATPGDETAPTESPATPPGEPSSDMEDDEDYPF